MPLDGVKISIVTIRKEGVKQDVDAILEGREALPMYSKVRVDTGEIGEDDDGTPVHVPAADITWYIRGSNQGLSTFKGNGGGDQKLKGWRTASGKQEQLGPSDGHTVLLVREKGVSGTEKVEIWVEYKYEGKTVGSPVITIPRAD